MKDDPFRELSGLDQRLFGPSSPSKGDGKTKGKGSEKVPTKGPSSESWKVRKSEGRSERRKIRSYQRPFEPEKERPIERRPYDFYRDQLLWLKRTKVEIEERYGSRVTANAMVQLALDLFIEDYKRRKEGSKLVTNLVLEQRTNERSKGGSR